MACAKFEPLIALFVGGEIVSPEVEAHLRTCAECRGFAEELERSQAALRSLREEEAPAAALAEVRGRVLDQIVSRKPSWWFALRWRYALVPAAAVVVLVVALSPRPDVPAPPAPPALRLAIPTIAKSKPAPVRRPVPKPQEPLLVKMFTDDPDVVIYWLIDAEGGS
jgi:anti-sigma factor RsiW